MPHFIGLYDKYRERGLEIIGLSVDMAGLKAVSRWLEDNPGFKHGLIYYDGMYYGDFEIVSQDDEKLVSRVKPFDEKKAT